MKKSSIFIVSFFLMLMPFVSHAFMTKSSLNIYIEETETINDNLYALGEKIKVDGNITGDLICSATDLVINGQIEGDLICATENITINGSVNGSVRAIASNITINGEISRNANLVGEKIIIENDSVINGDLLLVAMNSHISGSINGDLHGLSNSTEINAQIAKNINLYLNEGKGIKPPMKISNEASVNGNLIYHANVEAEIADKDKIAGTISHQIPSDKHKEKGILYFWSKLFSIFSCLVIGLVLISLWSKHVKEITGTIKHNVNSSIAWGFGILFVSPLAIFILMLTIIGIPLALILLALWLIALYISRILVGILLGQLLLKKVNPDKKESLMWSMIIGITLLYILFAIPVIGLVASITSLLLGLGGIALFIKGKH